MTNSISDIEEADVILLTGTNTTANHPVIGERVKQAVLSGRTKLVIVDPRELSLSRYAALHLKPRPGTDVAWINGLARAILDLELQDKEFIAERTEGIEELEAALREYTPERVEEISGIRARDLLRAARMYGKAKRASILYAMGITQHITGTDNVAALSNLALLTGNLGKEGAGVNPLRGQNSVPGACDMGALPNVFTGYQKVDDEQANEKFSHAWGRELPRTPGLSVVEMMRVTTTVFSPLVLGITCTLYALLSREMSGISGASQVMTTEHFVAMMAVFLVLSVTVSSYFTDGISGRGTRNSLMHYWCQTRLRPATPASPATKILPM